MSLSYHSMFIGEDGTVKGVGYNTYGQLGLGHKTNPQTDIQTIPISGVKQISCGYNHTLFLMEDGSVKGTGYNTNGQLGLGHQTDQSSIQNVPISGVKQISCGYSHTLFLLEDGTVKGVGSNGYGQIGLGNTTNPQTTIQNVPISGVKQISCGYYHTLFLMEDGTVKGVGYNTYGQLGLGHQTNQTDIQTIPISGVKQISCGNGHTLFLLEDGTVKGVGRNTNGQLGLGHKTNQSTIQTIPLNGVSMLWDVYDDGVVLRIASLVYHEGKYKKWDGEGWVVLDEEPSTEEAFLEQGMPALTLIPSEAWNELGSFEIYTYRNQDKSMKAELTQVGSIYRSEKKDYAGQGKIVTDVEILPAGRKLIFIEAEHENCLFDYSLDGGQTWYTCNVREVIDITTKEGNELMIRVSLPDAQASIKALSYAWA